LLPPQVLRLGTAVAFLLAGLLVARRALRATNIAGHGGCGSDAEVEADCSPAARGWDWEAFGSTLGLLLVAELGDKTQLAVLSLSGQSQAPWAVFAGATLALTTVTARGVVGGDGLSRLLSKRALLGLSALAFVAAGVWTGLGIWSS
jgi:putative Ca2+/H+ antiporter (TMEM165/GDT1 family)